MSLGRPVLTMRSRCDHCDSVLSIADLVPIVSWVGLRGKCRLCGGSIDPALPIIEVAALVVVLWSALVVPPALLWPSALLGWLLLALSMVDIKAFRLPDTLTCTLFATGLTLTWFAYPEQLPSHLMGAVLGFSALYAIGRLFRAVRGYDGLGLGDAKLLGASAAWISWEGLPSVLLVGATSALFWILLTRLAGRRWDRHRPIPFGPFLCLGIWLVWLYGPLTWGV